MIIPEVGDLCWISYKVEELASSRRGGSISVYSEKETTAVFLLYHDLSVASQYFESLEPRFLFADTEGKVIDVFKSDIRQLEVLSSIHDVEE